MIRYSIDEEFYFPDGSKDTICVTGDDFAEWDEEKYDSKKAIDLLRTEYFDWISGTEPDGYVNEAESICLAGYFWTQDYGCSDEVEVFVVKGVDRYEV